MTVGRGPDQTQHARLAQQAEDFPVGDQDTPMFAAIYGRTVAATAAGGFLPRRGI